MCLELPPGEVHQCFHGHCLCLQCWNRLNPRVCPECRQPLPRGNRNRHFEERVQALRSRAPKHDKTTQTSGAPAHPLDDGALSVHSLTSTTSPSASPCASPKSVRVGSTSPVVSPCASPKSVRAASDDENSVLANSPPDRRDESKR